MRDSDVALCSSVARTVRHIDFDVSHSECADRLLSVRFYHVIRCIQFRVFYLRWQTNIINYYRRESREKALGHSLGGVLRIIPNSLLRWKLMRGHIKLRNFTTHSVFHRFS